MNDDTSTDTMVLAPVAADLSRFSHAREADRFGYCLLLAATLHAMMFIGFKSSGPSRLGAPGGADQAISVSLISSADLESRTSVDDFAAGKPAPVTPAIEPDHSKPAEAVPPPAAAPPVAATPAPAAEPAVEQSEAEESSEPAEAEKATEAPAGAAEQAPPLLRDSITEAPAEASADTKKPAEQREEVGALPERSAEPAAPRETEGKKPIEKEASANKSNSRPSPRPQAQTRTARLEEPSPPVVFSAPQGGGGAGLQRPPGITRSGENDAFARGVIRALQRTMPHLREATGRVTVRIKLDTKGNLASTKVMRPSRVAGMDQSVVFATHQSSFPLPPLNANAADLTFIVTYIYR